ncbi:gluconate 2-dehydrogenase subunit 3 family protein [Rudaea sp.]|uniref:gluconate 2-dehydrogenase subunit 3 family protein n=1 Tax=Rudaea sp. TaxID=2136325 RepID=UPI002ED6B1DB
MNRREVLQRVALLMGGAVSAPAAFAVLNGYGKEPGPDWKPAVLGEPELAVVSRIVDIMIPRTDTPGALDVGVPAFIDGILKDVYSQDARDRFLQGARDFDAAAREAQHKPFVKLSAQQQKAFVQKSQDAAIADERALSERKQKALVQEIRDVTMLPQRTETAPETHQRAFILTVKELTLLGFFTSQPGATQVL